MAVTTALRAARALLVGVALITGSALGAAPGAAAGPTGVACGFQASQHCLGTTFAEQVGAGGPEAVTFNCAVVTPRLIYPGGPAQETILHCYLRGVIFHDRHYAGGGQAVFPGLVGAVAGVAAAVPVQPYQLCVLAGVLTSSGVHVPSAPTCFFALA